jgi:hypothetical protein
VVLLAEISQCVADERLVVVTSTRTDSVPVTGIRGAGSTAYALRGAGS